MLIKMISIVVIACSFNLYADDANTPTAPATTTTTTTTTTVIPDPNAAPATPVTTAPFSSPPTIIVVPDQSQATPGGYNDISVKDPGVQAAAKYAVNQIQQGRLVNVAAAQVQVVAGKNYQLQLVLAQRGGNYQYSVTVFVPLPSSNQPMQVTNVQAMGLVDSGSENGSVGGLQ